MTTTKITIKSATLTAFLLLAFGFFQGSTAQDVNSDYEIVQNFNNTYNKIQTDLDTVTTVKGAEALNNRVQSLRENYNDHKELLNKALYPNNYDRQIKKLSTQVKSTHKRLQLIAKQRKKLNQLTGNVNRFEDQLSKLRSETDSLQKLLDRQSARSQQLSRSVQEYKENVTKRDELILAFVDSVVTNYQQLNTQTLQELSKAYQESRKNIDSNPLKLIQSMIQSNIDFLNSTQTLAASDYLRMYQVQQKFRDMWNTVGSRILKVYSPENSNQAIESEIKSALDEWETKVADQTWKSLNQAFAEADIELSEFGDAEGFYKSLTSYIDNQIENGNRQQFENFNEFWNNTVKSDWAASMVENDILTYEQMSQVDQKLTEWDKKTAPVSYFWPILLAVAVLIIIVLGIMLARVKS